MGWLSQQNSFYMGLGLQPNLAQPNHALALILFSMVTSMLGFFLNPVMATVSRQHEFEADAYASRFAPAASLRSALLRWPRRLVPWLPCRRSCRPMARPATATAA